MDIDRKLGTCGRRGPNKENQRKYPGMRQERRLGGMESRDDAKNTLVLLIRYFDSESVERLAYMHYMLDFLIDGYSNCPGALALLFIKGRKI